MSAVTRIGDTTSGSCDVGIPDHCPHSRTGINSQGSPNVFVNSRAVHRLGDGKTVICPHGGAFVTTSGSASVFVNSIPIARVGDSTACQLCGMGGSHISGSNNVFSG